MTDQSSLCLPPVVIGVSRRVSPPDSYQTVLTAAVLYVQVGGVVNATEQTRVTRQETVYTWLTSVRISIQLSYS